MPAVELNTMQPDAVYDYAKEKAVFKLWLVLTTNQFLAAQGVQMFNTTAEADAFQAANVDAVQKIYFVDLEKLAAQLQPMAPAEVIHMFRTLMTDQPHFLQMAANLYFNYSRHPCEYGPGGCITMQKVLDIGEPVPDEAQEELLLWKKKGSQRTAKPIALKWKLVPIE